jgi:hypothetical protein
VVPGAIRAQLAGGSVTMVALALGAPTRWPKTGRVQSPQARRQPAAFAQRLYAVHARRSSIVLTATIVFAGASIGCSKVRSSKAGSGSGPRRGAPWHFGRGGGNDLWDGRTRFAKWQRDECRDQRLRVARHGAAHRCRCVGRFSAVAGTVRNVGIPYRMIDSMSLQKGSDIQIEPGTNFVVAADKFIEIGWNSNPAKLVAVGSSASPITFRGEQDTAGSWAGIVYRASATGDGKFEHVQIINAGKTGKA